MLELVGVLIGVWDVCRKEAMSMGNKRLRAEFCISAKCNAAEIVILHEQLILYIEIADVLRQSLGLTECGTGLVWQSNQGLLYFRLF